MEATFQYRLRWICRLNPAAKISSGARAAVALTFLSASLLTVRADVRIVAPNNLGNLEGNTGDYFPFGSISPVRWQQVYDSSQFSGIAHGGVWITAILFRVDAGSRLGATSD